MRIFLRRARHARGHCAHYDFRRKNSGGVQRRPRHSAPRHVFIALHDGKIYGESSGFFSGLFLDFLGACPLGFNCLFRTIIGYAGGKFCKILNTEGFVVPFLIVLISTLMKVFLVQVISLLFPSVTVAYKIISFSFAFELLANSFLAPFMFRLLRVFKNSLVLRPENVN